MNEQSHYKQDKIKTRQSINVKSHIFNVGGDNDKTKQPPTRMLSVIQELLTLLLYLRLYIKYALTKNPPIYESFIKQFWQTASASTLEDGEVGITATIDGQLKTVIEVSLRRHLKLEDADGISSLPNTEIFEQLALMGVQFCRVKNQQSQLNEAASIRVDVRLGGAATTVSSLDAGQGSVLETDLKETKKVYSNAFTKLIMKVKKLEKIVKSNKARRRAKFIVSDDEEDLEDYSKNGRRIADIDQDSDISLVHHDGDIQGRYKDISTTEFNISTAKPVSTDGAAVTTGGNDDEEDLEDSSKQGRRIADIDQDSDISLVHYNADIQGRYEDISTAEFNISTAKPVSHAGEAVTTDSVSTAEPSKGKMVESEKPSKKKDQVKADEELAKRLEEEMQAELEEEARIERIAQEEASIAGLTAEFDVVQARMDANALLAAKIQEEEREQFSINEQARFLVGTIAKRKRFFAAQRAE
ncbi:hypothetical protein Tco_1217111 [Tanacetum coccineum]